MCAIPTNAFIRKLLPRRVSETGDVDGGAVEPRHGHVALVPGHVSLRRAAHVVLGIDHVWGIAAISYNTQNSV